MNTKRGEKKKREVFLPLKETGLSTVLSALRRKSIQLTLREIKPASITSLLPGGKLYH
jgi:hypothetical protein